MADLTGNNQNKYTVNGSIPIAHGPSKVTFVRPDDSNAYTALDVISNSATAASNLEFQNIGTSGGYIEIKSITFLCSGSAVPGTLGVLRLHLYDENPTVINDNAAYNLPVGDRNKYLGYVDFPTPIDLGDTIWSNADEINKVIKLKSNSTSLFGILQTINSCTPAPLLSITIGMNVISAGV